MRKIVTFTIALLFVAIYSNVIAQNNHTTVKYCGFDKIQISLKTGEIQTKNVSTAQGDFTKLSIQGFYHSQKVGKPDLPVLSEMLEIPLCDKVEVKIISQKNDSFTAEELGISHPIFPHQPSYSKSYEGERPFMKDAETYASNSFYSNNLIKVEKNGLARDVNLATLYFSPISYNPISGEIKVCTEVEIEITFVNSDAKGTEDMKKLYHSEMFAAPQTINTLPKNATKNEISSTPIHYLIVAHSSFRNQLDSLIQWKKRKGFLVTIGYTDESSVGTTSTSIASYIKRFYTNATASTPAPTYILLVGDVAQIPAFNSNAYEESYWYGSTRCEHVTDLYYATWTSGDTIPDCYYGRFSAQNTNQLTPQVEKTLMYERCSMSNTSYLNNALLIAGIDDGTSGDYGYTHADPTIAYISDNYVNTTNGYSTVTKYLNSDYTLDRRTGLATGMTSTINTTLSNGVGLANYTAHCSEDGWYNPSYEVSDLSSLNNTQKFGIMIGNCCLSNKFDESECFGEAVLRKSNYQGAVGYIGGSNSTYWDEDYYWSVGIRNINNYGTTPSYNSLKLGVYDCLFHTHNEAYSKWYVSLGGMIFRGDMSVQSSTSDLKLYYWEIYHLMGDPSIMPWLHVPSAMTITTDTNLATNATSLTVQAVPYAYIALTDNNLNLVASAFANSTGSATLSFSALSNGTYELAASAQNYKTTFTTITVSASGTGGGTQNINVAKKSNIKIYPNPAKNILFVEGENLTQVSLTNMLGQEIFSTSKTNNNKVSIDLDKCPKGFYIVRTENKWGEKTFKKIIIKK